MGSVPVFWTTPPAVNDWPQSRFGAALKARICGLEFAVEGAAVVVVVVVVVGLVGAATAIGVIVAPLGSVLVAVVVAAPVVEAVVPLLGSVPATMAAGLLTAPGAFVLVVVGSTAAAVLVTTEAVMVGTTEVSESSCRPSSDSNRKITGPRPHALRRADARRSLAAMASPP